MWDRAEEMLEFNDPESGQTGTKELVSRLLKYSHSRERKSQITNYLVLHLEESNLIFTKNVIVKTPSKEKKIKKKFL